MKERPILFSGPMVRAILEGRKTQTRRVVKPTRRKDGVQLVPELLQQIGVGYACPHGTIGDRLWVRESFCRKADDSGYSVWTPDGDLDSSCCHYRADGIHVVKLDGDGGTEFTKSGREASPWRPSIHMPRWASRITLEITGVRVERVQYITEEDAKAEGLGETIVLPGDRGSFVQSFAMTWNQINGPESWSANPWVWVIEFRRVQQCKT